MCFRLLRLGLLLAVIARTADEEKPDNTQNHKELATKLGLHFEQLRSFSFGSRHLLAVDARSARCFLADRRQLALLASHFFHCYLCHYLPLSIPSANSYPVQT